MNESEIWITELRNQILEVDDIVLFNEATGCFLSQHYRAAYIMSWISLIESLKRKIKEFSDIGDKKAIEAVKSIEKIEEQKHSTDKLIFEESKKIGIIDNADLSTINYLWEQRCLFAHPYNKQPEIDEVKYIIGQTVKLVLGKQLFYNRDFLTQLTENIATKPFFLPYQYEKIREFANTTISRTPTVLHPFFFKTLLSKVGELINISEKSNELKKLRYFIIELFANTTLNLTDEKWSLENRVTDYPYESVIGFVDKDIWRKLPERIKEMLIAFVINEKDTKRLNNLNIIIGKLITNDVLEDNFKQNFHDKLKSVDFNSAINFYGNDESKYYRIILELESWDFYKQNIVIDYFKSIVFSEFLDKLDKEKQIYLGKLLKVCATKPNFKTERFLVDIEKDIIKVPENVKAGIAISSFINLENKYSIKKDSIVNAIKLLNKISEEIQNEVYSQIFEILENSSPARIDRLILNESPLTELSKQVDNSIHNWTDSNKSNFDKLMETIRKFIEKPCI